MKRIFYIVLFVFTAVGHGFAQDEEGAAGGKLREKMIEYIKDKLSLTKDESDKFQPIFLDYLKQLRATRDQYKSDPILMQQKVAELKLRTRDQFKPILGEKRSNDVFVYAEGFKKLVQQELKNRQAGGGQGRANKKTRMLQ